MGRRAGDVRHVPQRVLDLVRADGARTVLRGPAAGFRVGRVLASADYASGDNERPVQEAVASLLHPGSTFFDVGANVGFFSLIASRRVGPTGRVVAFEAVPAVAAELGANLARNGVTSVDVRVEAVGAAPGRAELRLTRHPGGATIAEGAIAPDVVEVVETAVVSLDDLWQRGEVPGPDVVKIDVEGHEEAVLEGMRDLLATVRPALVVELDAPTLRELDRRASSVEARLHDGGYRAHRLASSYPGTHWAVTHLVATAG
jgi:FkbM family methyltransferase